MNNAVTEMKHTAVFFFSSIVGMSFGLMMLSACAAAEESPVSLAKAGQNQKSMALSIDFSDYIDKSRYVTFDNMDQFEKSDLAIQHLTDLIELGRLQKPVESLSPAELLASGTYREPRKKFVNTWMMFHDIVQFQAENGRLPRDGMELCGSLDVTHIPISKIDEVDLGEVASECITGINPITGRFHQTYEATEWSPGAIMLQCIADPEAVQEQIGNLSLLADPMDVSQGLIKAGKVWKLKVWGETEGSVLIEAEYWTQ